MLRLWSWRALRGLLSKKRVGAPSGGQHIAASVFPHPVDFANQKILPSVHVGIHGKGQLALLDSGCSKSLAFVGLCTEWTEEKRSIVTINGQRQECLGLCRLNIDVQGTAVCVEVLVLPFKPLNYSVILGMNAIVKLGGVHINPDLEVKFGAAMSSGSTLCVGTGMKTSGGPNLCVAAGVETSDKSNPCMAAGTRPSGAESLLNKSLRINEPDFCAWFEEPSKKWHVRWKWANGREGPMIPNTVARYKVAEDIRPAFEAEINNWIKNEYLIPYDEKLLGPPKALISLMAVVQEHKRKVRPILDFRSINRFISVFTAKTDVCSEKIREWRRMGANVTVCDLSRAYMQLMVDKSLWPYQTVQYKGQRYALSRLGFGLNVSPVIMTAIMTKVLQSDEILARATSFYLDDIFLDENIASTEYLVQHLQKFGLQVKPPEKVVKGARVLGLHVWGGPEKLLWKRDNSIPELPDQLTRRIIFSICGQLLGHLPVCGQLRVMTSFIKRRANMESNGWDDVISSPEIHKIMQEMMNWVRSKDPATGRWDVSGDKGVLWVDASSLASAAVLEIGGEVVEDGCWLRPQNDASHINMAELDAVLKGINLAIAWGLKDMEIFTDSRTVFHWTTDTLTGQAKVKSSSASEMLILRRLGILKGLVDEFQLKVKISFVRSECNRADALTRVPSRWLKGHNEFAGAALVADQNPKDLVKDVHENCGHPGIKRTHYFAAKMCSNLSKDVAREVVRECQICQ